MSKRGTPPTGVVYWAAVPAEEIAQVTRWRFERYQEQLQASGRKDIWKIADRCLHGRNPDGTYSNSVSVTFDGKQGEIAKLHVGHYRRIVLGQLTLATSQRPAIECTAVNNDPESVASTVVGRQLLDFDLDEGGLEEQAKNTHLRALNYSEAFIVQTWDPFAGELVGVDQLDPQIVDGGAPGIPDGEAVAQTGAPVDVPRREGAVRVEVRSPIDVARDLEADTAKSSPWHIVRTRVHRWELAARFPEDADRRQAILDAPSASSDEDQLWGKQRDTDTGEHSDYVSLLTLYHQQTDALPHGRVVEIVGDTMLFDGPFHYDHCVVHADIPSEELDAARGYADAWDMLAVSQALDAVESGLLSVADAGSMINWVAARGQSVEPRDLMGGMRLIEFDDDGMNKPPPGLMDRPEVRESDVKLADRYIETLRTLSGQNAVVQGDPDANIKSGNFAALVASMAVQAINAQAAAYAGLLRSVATGRIKLYQAFATTERVIEVAGRDKTGHVQTFTGEKLKGVRRVRVELGNPIQRTLQGKADLADKMLERYGPAVITPQRFFALLETGRLDDIADAPADHIVIARRENDMFRQGKSADEVQVLISDHHATHIAEHLKEINDSAVRMDPKRAAELEQRLVHLNKHISDWPMVPPALLAATGQQPAPMPMGPMGPPGMPPGAPANDNGMPPGMGAMPGPSGPPANDNGPPMLPPAPGPLENMPAPAAPASNPMTGAPPL